MMVLILEDVKTVISYTKNLILRLFLNEQGSAMMSYYHAGGQPVPFLKNSILRRVPMRKTAKPTAPNDASASVADASVRKEFPETWLWQTIAKRLDTVFHVLLDYCIVCLFSSMVTSKCKKFSSMVCKCIPDDITLLCLWGEIISSH